MKYEDPCAASGSESPYTIGFQKQKKRSVLTLLLTSAADHSCSCWWVTEITAQCWKSTVVPWQGDMKKSHVLGSQTSCVQLDGSALFLPQPLRG